MKEIDIERFGTIDFNYNKNLCQENKNCTICLIDFVNKEKLRILPCMHRFHATCADPWLCNLLIK